MTPTNKPIHSKASDVLIGLVTTGQAKHILETYHQDILGLIGDDAYWYVDGRGNKQTNQFNDTVNGERRRLRTALATYFGEQK